MEDIRNRIIELVPKIKNYKKKNVLEAGTKRGLIEPLFETIGWDFSDIDTVEPEFPIVIDGVKKPADYALKVDKKIKAFIEAKRISSDIKLAIQDGTRKALEKKVHWLIATNGDTIAVLKIDKKITESERTIFQITITETVNDDQELNKAINLLSLLNPKNITSEKIEDFSKKEIERIRMINVLKSLFKSKEFRNLVQKKYIEKHLGDMPDQILLEQVIGMIIIGSEKPIFQSTIKINNNVHGKQKVLERIFKYPNKRDKEQIKKNIIEKKDLWLKFIEAKEMSTQEFKDHYKFKTKATGGFTYYLSYNGLAEKIGYDNIRKGAIFKINEDIIPEIKAILGIT